MTDDPIERLLARYGFKVEHPDPRIDRDVLFSTLGVPSYAPDIQTHGGERRQADMLHFYPFHQEDDEQKLIQILGFWTKEAAEKYVFDEFKEWLCQAKERGHDTFFMRLPMTTTSTKEFGNIREIWRACLRGTSWNSAIKD